MPTELIQIGPATPILQGVVYSIPSIPVEITSGAVVQSSILYTGPFTNISNGLMNGCFIKCVTGNTTVTLKKKVIGEAAVTPPVVPFNGLVSVANLVSYWKLDEATGNRLDSVGTNHLTPTNAPVGAAGKIGNGCDLEFSSGQYLSHSDPTPLGDEDWTYTAWFKRESFATVMQLIAKDHNITAGRFYSFEFNTSGAGFFYFHRTTPEPLVNAVIAAGLDNTNWHFIVLWHDAAANTISVQLNNGTPITTPYTAYQPSVTVTDFNIGSRQYPGNENYFDGIIDEVGLWRRVLTAAERTALYNSGNGLPYSFS